MADGPDELFTLRNNFYLGNFTQCVHEGGSLRVAAEALQTERDTLVVRSYLAMGNTESALAEVSMISSDSPAALQAVKLHAELAAYPEKKDQVLQSLKSLLGASSNASNPLVQIIAATIYQSTGDHRSALRTMRNFEGGLEAMAFGVQCYLAMNLVDKAYSLLKKMQSIDDDATLSQLANAWVFLAVGGTKYEESYYIFQELIDKYGETVPLLNGIAVALMHQGNYDQASPFLVTALSKNGGNPDTLVNMIVCAQHLSKPTEVINRYLRELRKHAPQNPWLLRYNAAVESFDRVA
mmetsp:Transcript_18531/g.27107  ORF Transcript_18531/g.27107 Transcript_18531/m.27107 type:complete len:295 (+) Transcript_18531:123-1007(+)|eukprot:CAMPEP_0195522544 /NCGR_PEP_ID=MMETSP0794_2-20130614/20811_1 /TAXON_ID=515487 /ORGANISM="Stephanopyxis turris, Strain CCMP 815" /LENGTH=294 /DNA_ID=CAMNT_0040652319 /DNA_START=116 /DNA_END=1000 /DNA_ORIENTATION=+